MVWEAIFLLVVLKIPIVYLCAVVWIAIRAEPRPEEPAALVGARVPELPQLPLTPTVGRSRRRRPSVGPSRRPGGGRVAPARALRHGGSRA